MKAELTQKDKDFREFAQTGNMWKVALKVGLPLAFYQLLTMLFKFLDSMMASHIGTSAVSAVSFIHQITMMIGAVGGGLAIGAGMKASEAYGAGDFMLVKKRVSTVYAMCALAGGIILLVTIPFSKSILLLVGTPQSLADIGNDFFRVELIATVLSFFNTIYIAIERARGNTTRILFINVVVSVVKLVCTALFVYVLHGDVVMIAAATLVSQVVFLIFAVLNMRGKDNAFGFSLKAISFEKNTSGIVLKRSFPVMIEKIAFSYGKLIVNTMSTVYGDSTVGALGISNNISGLGSNIENGFQEAGASIISQNLGAGNKKRAVQAFRTILCINVIIGTIFLFLTLWQLDFISGLFAPTDEEFRQLIKEIYSYEALAAVTLGINSAVMALLYGFGLTKLSLAINFSRVFVFRIPVLWYLQNYTDLGSKSVGIVMLVSNVSIGIVALIAAAVVVRKIKRSDL